MCFKEGEFPALAQGSRLAQTNCLLPFLKSYEASHGLLTLMECPLQEALGIRCWLSVLMLFGGFPGKQPSDEPASWLFIKTSGESPASSKAAAVGT